MAEGQGCQAVARTPREELGGWGYGIPASAWLWCTFHPFLPPASEQNRYHVKPGIPT